MCKASIAAFSGGAVATKSRCAKSNAVCSGASTATPSSKAIDPSPNLDHYHISVALAPEAKKAFPSAPTKVVCLDWSVQDPSKVEGTPAEIKAAYESTYQFLHAHIQDLVEAVNGDKID